MFASRARRTGAAGSAGEEQDLPVGKDRSGVYRYVGLGVWLFISTFMVLDRFYWNVWPRQSICTDGCGGDFFCDMDDDPGCLKAGPWSAKVFDVIARISARLIISTTNLIFITMCHGTWNWLSEINMLRSLLYSWRADNAWLHAIGGWTLGVVTLLHVWSLFLPSMFHGYQNKVVGGPFDIPLQVGLMASNVDVQNKLANWGYDDVWRLIWMTLIFCVLTPLSRSVWALKKNFSLAMWLHIGVGMGYFFDNWRRRTHPHVWILNTPVVLWYIADKIWCCTEGRVNHRAETTRIKLDEDYMLLLWNEDQPKSICDIFWLKHSDRDSKGSRRTGEVAHPFTTCSSHDTAVGHTSPEAGISTVRSPGRPNIEVPLEADVNWKGHRFLLTSGISQRSNALESTLRSSRAFYGTSDLSVAIKGDGVVVQPRGGGKGALRNVEAGASTKWQMTNFESLYAASSGAFSEHFPVDDSGHELATKEYHVNLADLDEEGIEAEEDTMIGVNADDSQDEVAVVVGTLKAKANLMGDCSLISDSVENLFEQDLIYNNTVSSAVKHKPDGDLEEAGDDGESTTKNKIAIRRLGTREFHAFRKVESAEGRVGPVTTKSWSKMAIVRLNRRTSQSSPCACTCIGLTWVLNIFRTPETASIADVEETNDLETIPLRVYGPYRSEYGRLEEFPNLPPLLIIATGAGAGLVLDFVGFIRAKKITPKRPVKVCYSSASLALLQFVTNTLLAERTPGIQVETALTRHEELEMFNTTNQPKPELVIGRLDVKSIIRGVSEDTEVYFCGGGGINTLLREACAKRGMKYVGSAVQ
ncbi:unnamed protein product [Ectocarpus sp. 6 AP-2014]